MCRLAFCDMGSRLCIGKEAGLGSAEEEEGAGMLGVPTAGRSEYGRVKVALDRGKGLMDWIAMTTGKQMSVRRPFVDHTELMRHDKQADCWMLIHGEVYDVTRYLEYHPGGIPELMRAAGTDGTGLFNQYHAWVNYQSMLKACHVGPFRGDAKKLPPVGPSTIDESSTSAGGGSNSLCVPGAASTPANMGIKLSSSGDCVSISCDAWRDRLRAECVAVNIDKQIKRIRILIRPFSPVSGGGLKKDQEKDKVELVWERVPVAILSCDGVSWEVEEEGTRLALRFHAVPNLSYLASPALCVVKKAPLLSYHACTIQERQQISHDTILLRVAYPEGLSMPVPAGHHIDVKVKKGAGTLYRPYTPVPFHRGEEAEGGAMSALSSLPLETRGTALLIKIYDDGICTPSLGQLREGDVVEVSDPMGSIDFCRRVEEGGGGGVCMLAAGTGLTPMLGLAVVAKEAQGSTRLLLFNKTEADIVDDAWMRVGFCSPAVTTEHVLSAGGEAWSGKRGRVEKSHVDPLPSDCQVYICGPDGFVESATRLLVELGHESSLVHIFQG